MLISLFRAYINRLTPRTLYNFLSRILEKMKLTSTIDHPPQFDPLQPCSPISYPIKTLEELETRSYFESFHCPFNKSSVPLKPTSLPNRPRLLVCHDMKGGYVDDKWVQGGTNADAYAIRHWYLIDVFVYFSHKLVTLPPPCWTNTAHRHGVKVLGTFITEWDEGRLICNKLLATKESAQMCAERLAELAIDLGFDGWLINMEVGLLEEQIPILKEFVSHLTHTMHSSMPESLIIWYDSVITTGNLSWQDQLNEKNKPFFDICDGIFVNYTWKSNYPDLSAAVAGDRKFDVYMGIDVYGRNTFGGGQWNTNVALDVLKKANVSAAIFAPGWLYETKQPPDFQTAQNCWWELVAKSWGRVNNYPKLLPFYSNFDQGQGYHISVEGNQLTDAPWNNMSCQGFQPCLEFIDGPTPDAIQFIVDFNEESYNGGGNITFKGTLEDNVPFTIRLFQGELLLDNVPLVVTYSVKSKGGSLLGLSLQFSSLLSERISVLVAPSEMNGLSHKFSKMIMPSQVGKMASKWIVHEGTVAMDGLMLTEIHAVCYRTNSTPRELRSESEVRADNQDSALAPSLAEYSAVLGHITIKNSSENLFFPPSTAWLTESQYIKYSLISQGFKTASLKILWKLKDGNNFLFPKYNIYVEKLAKQVDGNAAGRLEDTRVYLGAAHVQAFYISDLSIPSHIGRLKFIIQACAADGTCQELDDSPYMLLDVEGQ
ncbi:cytosolic endo-beta-N-acetylglucosaminidase [Salix suchowensis]|nr:cytosolic endo-beta-N-acetylglucosaminidase [Salix suchowensis]